MSKGRKKPTSIADMDKGKKHHGARKVNPETTQAREMQAWEMRARGMTQSEVAAELGVTQSAISKMLERARKIYNKLYYKRIKQVQAECIALCDRITSEGMNAWYKSVEQPDFENHPHGNPEYLHLVLKAQERKARQLGTDAASKTQNKNENKNENIIKSFTLEIPNANQLQGEEELEE